MRVRDDHAAGFAHLDWALVRDGPQNAVGGSTRSAISR